MNFKRVIKGSLAMALVFGTTMVAGCGNEDGKVDKSSKQYQIYQLAVEAGATDLSYEDWIISIKGAKGEKGDASKVTIGSNGNWFIDGVDTKVSAIPTSGKDGTTWLTGVEVPSNNQGKEGDFYFNSNTKDIYCKQDGVWAKKTTLYDGKDGTTWHSGSGAPSNNVIAKVGDFYFDKENKDIYFYTLEGWMLEVDLEAKEEVKELVLKPGIYTGYFGGSFFEVTFAYAGEELGITSIIVDGQEYANMAQVRYEIENNIVSLEVAFNDVNKMTTKLTLGDNNRFSVYVDEKEKELIKGYYEDWFTGTSRVLTLADSRFALGYGGVNFKGDWEIIGVNSDSYDVMLKSDDGKVFFATINYYYRYVDVYKFGDFKFVTYKYGMDEFVYSQIKTSSGMIEETIKIGDGASKRVVSSTSFELGYNHLLLVEIEDESYVLDYINGVVYDTKEIYERFVGKVNCFDVNGEFVYFEKRDEVVVLNNLVGRFGDYTIEYDKESNYLTVYVNDESAFWGSLDDSETNGDKLIVYNGPTKAEFTFNQDLSVKSLEIIEVNVDEPEETGGLYYLGEFGAKIEIDENGDGTIEWVEAGFQQEYNVKCEVVDSYLFIKVYINETKYITNYYRIGEKNNEGYIVLHNDLDKVTGVSKGLYTYSEYSSDQEMVYSFTLDIYSYESNNYFALLTETNYSVSGYPEVETRIVKVEIDNSASTLTFGNEYTYVINTANNTLTIDEETNNSSTYQVKNGGNFKTLSIIDNQNFVLVEEIYSSNGISNVEHTGTYEFNNDGYIVLTETIAGRYIKYYFSVNYDEHNIIVSIGGAPHGYNVRTFNIVDANESDGGSLAIYDEELNEGISNGDYYALLTIEGGSYIVRVNVSFNEETISFVDNNSAFTITSNGDLVIKSNN